MISTLSGSSRQALPVGLAYLDAHERIRQPWLLDAAKAAGECLVQGQLRSGGWQDRIEFAPAARAKFAYRVDPPNRKGRNLSTFDDDKTQSAMRFLLRLDFKNERVYEAISFALESVLKAQFPNGGWAQVYDSVPEPSRFPVKSAGYPEEWPQKYPGGDYWLHYTLTPEKLNRLPGTLETQPCIADPDTLTDKYMTRKLNA